LLDGVVNYLWVGDPPEKIVEDDVLVVTAQLPLCPPEPVGRIHLIHQPVVGAQEG
jgi:hypothetical protein